MPDGMTTLTDPAIWATSTCKLGWEVAGVFPQGADGTDINAVDADAARKHIVAGDDFGRLAQSVSTSIQFSRTLSLAEE